MRTPDNPPPVHLQRISILILEQHLLGSPGYTRTHCAVAGAARTGESRKQAGVGSAAALCVVCEHKHTKRRRLRRFDSKGADA